MKPKLENGVAPPARPERAPRSSYQFGSMQPGTSMFPLTKIGAASFRNYAWRHGWKYATEEQQPGKHRIWRNS